MEISGCVLHVHAWRANRKFTMYVSEKTGLVNLVLARPVERQVVSKEVLPPPPPQKKKGGEKKGGEKKGGDHRNKTPKGTLSPPNCLTALRWAAL